MSKAPHVHAAVIHAYADGAEIEFLRDGKWHSCLTIPAFAPDMQYRVKPEPVRVYPETRMTQDELNQANHEGSMEFYTVMRGDRIVGLRCKAFEYIANAALRHAIDNFQVVETGVVERLARKLAQTEADHLRTLKDHRLTPEEIDRDAQAIFKNALAGNV